MKIAMIHATLPSSWRQKEGGVTYFVHNFSNKLAEKGHEVTVFAFDERPSDALYNVHSLSTRHWLHTNHWARYYLVPLLFAQVKLSSFDLVHAHGDDWFLPSRTIPRLRTMHGAALAEADNSTNLKRRINQKIIYNFEKLAVRRASCSVANSLNTQKYFPGINEVVPCGVDNAPFKHQITNKSKNPSILYVGELEGRKRGSLLVKKFIEEIKPVIPDAELWLVADKTVEDQGIYNFGKVSQEKLIELYQQAWVFCLPSTYEGFGIPYIEAMAAGTPVVATSNPGSDEVLANGRYGLISSEKDLGLNLIDLLNSSTKRQEYAKHGLERAEQYSWERVVADYEAIYQRLVQTVKTRNN